MNAAFVLATAHKDLRRRLRDPLAFLLWIGIPLVIGGLMSLATGGSSGPAPRAPLFVVDQDDTFLSRALASAFGQAQLGELFEVRAATEEHARAELGDGEGSAAIVIPSGFGAAVLDEEPLELVLLKNPSQRILPGIVEEILGLLPDLVFYLHRLVGDELRRFEFDADLEPSDADVIEVSLAMRRAVERVEGFLFPPAFQIELVEADPAETEGGENFGQLFFPSMLFMSLLFMAQAFAEELWREKSQGALARLAVAPVSVGDYLLGKGVGALVLFVPVIGIGLGFGRLAFDLPLARAPLALVSALVGGFLFFGLFAALASLASTERGAGLVCNLVLFPLMMLGGSFFPFEAMPDWMSSIGRFTPNGWALTQFKRGLDGTVPIADVALGLVPLALSAVLVFALAAILVRRRLVLR